MRQLPLCSLMVGGASALPGPQSEVRTLPADVSAPAAAAQTDPESESESEPEPEPELSCDPDLPEGTRCGDNDARYCILGKCLKQADCLKACREHGNEVGRHCIQEARSQLCDGDECAPGYTNAATRCAIDFENGVATCAHLSCGVEPGSR